MLYKAKKPEQWRCIMIRKLIFVCLILLLSMIFVPINGLACDGGEGCTPGYWKNHVEAWGCTGYGPDDNYATVFGVSPTFPATKTLMMALKLGGGGEYALARHAVAAILNAGCASVEFGYSQAAVISMVQEAYNTDTFEAIKNSFVYQNEAGCPLN